MMMIWCVMMMRMWCKCKMIGGKSEGEFVKDSWIGSHVNSTSAPKVILQSFCAHIFPHPIFIIALIIFHFGSSSSPLALFLRFCSEHVWGDFSSSASVIFWSKIVREFWRERKSLRRTRILSSCLKILFLRAINGPKGSSGRVFLLFHILSSTLDSLTVSRFSF